MTSIGNSHKSNSSGLDKPFQVSDVCPAGAVLQQTYTCTACNRRTLIPCLVQKWQGTELQCFRKPFTLLITCRYIFLVGMLMSQFTITGFDACAHMSEETTGADKSAPMAIVMAIGVSAVAGFAYLLAVTFSIQVRQLS